MPIWVLQEPQSPCLAFCGGEGGLWGHCRHHLAPMGRARNKQQQAVAETLPGKQDCVSGGEKGKKEAVQLVWERTGWRCVSVRQRRGAQPLGPVSQDVTALPAIPEDKGCQELSGCPGQMPSILLATEPFLQTRPYTEQSDPAPWASPHPPIHFNNPIYRWNKGGPRGKQG